MPLAHAQMCHCTCALHLTCNPLLNCTLAAPRPLSTQRIFQLSLDIARALAYSHSQGLAHNDVKARNVLLCAGGAAKLCDFGLAKSVRTAFPSTFSRLSSTRTRLSSTAGSEDGLLGSLEWTAPENYTPGPHWGQPPADIYSFGCLLYEMVSGRAPWYGRNIGDVLSAVRRGERPTLPGGVDGRLAALMARCWTAAPERRPTAAALVAELTALVQPATAFTPQLVVRSPGAAAPGEYRPSAFFFTVFVKTLTRTLELQLPAMGQTTTAGLKALVERELGIPSAQQRLIFGGSELEEGHTLSEYSIQNASILHLAAGRGRVPSAADAPQEQLVARLVAMGFSRELALQGLESTGGLLTERTLDFLLQQQQQTRAGTAARGGGGGGTPAPAPAAATPAAARQPTEACCVLA